MKNEFYNRFNEELKTFPIKHLNYRLDLLEDGIYNPLRYTLGLKLLKSLNRKITEKDKDFLYAVELINISFYYLNRTIDSSKVYDKNEQAYYLLMADGLLTQSYKHAPDNLELLTSLVDDILLGRSLLLNIEENRRKLMILEEIIELNVCSTFKVYSKYAAKKENKGLAQTDLLNGLCSMIGLYFYYESELDELVGRQLGISVSVGLTDLFGIDYLKELSIDILQTVEEYRQLLNLDEKIFSGIIGEHKI